MQDEILLDEEIALVIAAGHAADLVEPESSDDYKPTFLRQLERDIGEETSSTGVRASQTSYGYGADAIAVAVALSGLSALLLSGKRIQENLDAWISLGRRLKPLVGKLKQRFGPIRLSESAAFAIALDAVSQKEASMPTVVLVAKAITKVPNTSLGEEFHALFEHHPDRYYVFTIEVDRLSHVVGVASTGDVLFHHRLDLNWHKFPRLHGDGA